MTLRLFSSAKTELEVLENKSQIIEHKMIADQHQYFVDSSGLGPFLDVLNHRDQKVLSLSLPELTWTESSLKTPTIFNRES
jgi:hypothetical protein